MNKMYLTGSEVFVLKTVKPKKYFYFYLSTGEVYLLALNFNFEDYKIKKGYLYQGLKKIGKILDIRMGNNEEYDKLMKSIKGEKK